MPARRFRPRALAAATVLALGAGLLGAAPAEAAPIGTISGTVTDTEGTALPGTWVSLQSYDAGTNDWTHESASLTTETGEYSFVDLEPATYRLYFDGSPDYFGEYWDDAALADDAAAIVVTEETPTFDADAQLTEAAKISGTVTGAGGLPLDGVHVTAYAYSEDEDQWLEATSGNTDANGRYQLRGLTAGTYRVGFDEEVGGTYLDEFWEDAPTVELATDIEVELGETAGDIDARLAEGGRITGTVTGPDDEALADVQVIAYRYDDYTGDWNEVEPVRTEADGTYNLAGLEADDYRIEFRDTSGRYLLDEYYNDVPDFVDAEKVSVTAEQTTADIDARLTSGGAVTGTVTGGGGPLFEAEVDVYRYDPENDEWPNVGGALTEADGSYRVNGLPSGSYRVEFSARGMGFVNEYWNDAPDENDSDQVVVVEGVTTEEIDADLAETGSLSGIVTGAGGERLAGVQVTAFKILRDEWGWERIGGATANDRGEYVISDLPPGAVRLGFYDGTNRYLEEYWEDAATQGEADDVTVASGRTTPVGTAELELSGSISGKVAGVGGLTYEGAYVELYRRDPGSGSWSRWSGQSASGGSYRFGGLPAGSYRIGFVDHGGGGYLPEYWQDAATVDAADDIAVTAGDPVELPDAQLGQGGRITGTVRDEGGTPVGSVGVTAYRWNEVDESWV